jgi:hypothetical protein
VSFSLAIGNENALVLHAPFQSRATKKAILEPNRAFYTPTVMRFAEASICLPPGITHRVALKTSGQNAA